MIYSGENKFTFNGLERSEWRCYMFGGDEYGLCYTPRKGYEPNAFWRTMQFLAFGHRWVKVKK